ncbi:MAG: TIGR02996 domain-containing protein [Planctomycetes bacterium]|nr:TIGR02996 domain-containing protein [Planctomycetota bacterium]
MTDRDALLRAIIDHPDEDTPRLVFADWLDEHADALPDPAGARAHARFVRDDIARSRLDEFDPLRLRWELVDKPRREREPWANAALPRLPSGTMFARDPLFRRGFPWAVTMHSAARTLPDPPVGAFPLERLYYLLCGYFGIDQLRAAPWRGRLRAVEFERGNTSSIGPRRLLAVDGLDRLERLAFRRDAIGAAEARELIAAPLFGRLSALTVTAAPVGAAVAEGVACLGPTGLRELQLVDCRVTPAALEELLRSPGAGKLESLSVGGDRIGAPEKFRALGRVRTPPPLRSLDVSEDSPKDAGLEAFLAAPLVTGLRRLALARCTLNSGRARLIASGAFAELRALDLSHNAIGNEGAAALARSPHLAGLLVLDLGYSQVGDEGILAILESPLADGLVLLDLTGSPASAETKELVVGRMGDRARV